MKTFFSATATALLLMIFTISSCAVQEEKKIATPAAPTPAPPAPKAQDKAPPAEKAPAKDKVEKTKGDVGLLDLEKNYMILVTKEGKLVTLDFDQKTKVTKVTPTPSKIADVGLGSSATVTYTKENNKNVANNVEYKAAKGGD
jgi:hypothetical protein